MFDRWASLFFQMKILSKDPYLKSFNSRVRTNYRERFCSSRASVIRLRRAPYFLTVPHSTVGTIAVNLMTIITCSWVGWVHSCTWREEQFLSLSLSLWSGLIYIIMSLWTDCSNKDVILYVLLSFCFTFCHLSFWYPSIFVFVKNTYIGVTIMIAWLANL